MAAARRRRAVQEELCGLGLAGVGLFALGSLFSWQRSAATVAGLAPPAANWGGVVGDQLATILVTALGASAFLMVVLWAYGAYLLISHASWERRRAMALGGCLLLLGSAAILQLALPPAQALSSDPGGWLGRVLTGCLVPYCNRGGTLLISALVAVLGAFILLPHGAAKRRRRRAALHGLGRLFDPAWRLLGVFSVAPRRGAARRHRPALVVAGRRVAVASGATANSRTHLPSVTLLDAPKRARRAGGGAELTKQAANLERTLHDFGVDGRVVQVLPGPVVTMYEFEPASGIRVSRIVNLADDLALGMQALSVRIVAPIPGKSAVGIEIPNPQRQPVCLRDVIASPAFRQTTSKLLLALGKDILGAPAVTDLAQIPHLLIAGATGAGKSVGLNSMICSILLNATPDEVKFIMIDPKMLELSVYDGIPHLIAPVVTHPKQAATALHWAVEEMERRYRLLAEHGVRGIEGFNQAHAERRLPYIVIVIDELADLMLVARRDVEDSLTRLAQMARAAGLHLLVATQRPSVDVLTGIIKANFPARISYQVSSRTDSRTILDAIGAERLLGKGDLLFLPPGTSKLVRIHGAYVSEAEIKRVVQALRSQQAPVYDGAILQESAARPSAPDDEASDDQQYDQAVALVARLGQASAPLLRQHLHLGQRPAARLLERLEREGVVGPEAGGRRREVYVHDVPTPRRR